MSEIKKKSFHKRQKLQKACIKAFIVTVISCFLSYLIVVPLSESLLAKLFSAPETSDFTMSDMFIQFADSRPVRHLDNRIAVVDIGYAGREEITEGLEILAAAEPKVVGLDVNFPDRKGDIDNDLFNSILALSDRIVLPLGLDQKDDKFEINEKPFFYDTPEGKQLSYGVINLPAKSSRASIREFEVDFPLSSGASLPSYVTQMARMGDPEAYSRLLKRGNARETIDYASREFNVIPINELLDRAGELTDKIVLMGSLGDAYDLHSTPLNSYQAGLLIHANSLATVLDGSWYVTASDLIDFALAVILCFLLILAAELIVERGRDIVLRIVQIIIMALSVWIGYNLFLDHHILLDLTYTFFVVGIGLLVLDLWHGINHLWKIATAKRQARQNLTPDTLTKNNSQQDA